MESTLNFEGKKYISAKDAAKKFGYTSDYIGQLCRGEKIKSKLVGRTWYVLESELFNYKKDHTSLKRDSKKIYSEDKNFKTSKKTKTKNKLAAEEEFLSEESSKAVLPPSTQAVFVGEKESNSPDLKSLSYGEGSVQKASYLGYLNNKSRLSEIDSKNILYVKDDSELFPKLNKTLDLEYIKRHAFDGLNKSKNNKNKVTNFDKFVVAASFLVVVFSSTFFGFFEGSDFLKTLKNQSKGSPLDELALLYSPLVRDIKVSASRFSEKTGFSSSNLALSVASDTNTKLVFDFVRSIGNKIFGNLFNKESEIVDSSQIEDSNTVKTIVIKETTPSSAVPVAPPRVSVAQPNVVQPKTVFIPSFDKQYIDLVIEEKFLALKSYFITNPLAPNVNRYYISKQNDVLVDRIAYSSGSSGSSGVTNLSSLSDVSLTSPAYGELLMYNGSSWVNVATSSLGISGSGTVTSISTNNGLTGGVINTTGTIGLNTTGLSLNGVVTWDGSNLVATGTPQLTVGNILATSTNATSTFYHNLAINGTGTTTSNGGFNISGGCFAINNNCISGGVGSGASSTLLADFNTFSNTNNFTGSIGLSTTSPFARLSINNTAGEHAFVIGSSTATQFIVDKNGRLGIGTSTPSAKLTIIEDSGVINHISGPGLNSRGSIHLIPANNTDGNSVGITFGSNDAYISSVHSSTQAGIFVEGSGDYGTRMHFSTSNNFNFIGAQTRMTITEAGLVGIGTTTPTQKMTVNDSTAPQISLSAGTGIAQWAFRNAGGNLYFSTTTVAGTATTSISALEVSGSGFGTTTVRGLNIIGQATSTSNVGFNITAGCYAVNDICISGGSGASSTLLADTNTWSGVNRFTYASSTYHSFSTASTTNLSIGGQTFISLLGSGLSNTGNTLTVSNLTTSNFTSPNVSQFTNDAGYTTYTWPFTPNTGYVSTTTTLGLLNGFFSTASSTVAGDFRLPSLSAGSLAVGANGLVYSAATTTAGTGLTYSGGAFNVNTTQNITNLSNISSNGLLYTAGGSGTLNTIATTTVSCSGSASCSSFVTLGSTPITITATGGGTGGGSWATTTIVGSANYFNYSLNATDVVGIGSTAGTSSSKFWFDPNTSSSFLSYASSTGWSSTYASTTNLVINGESFNDLTGTGLALSGSTLSTSNIPNASLQNSTISGIALGSNLADLTATDSTLTFSGSYNGSTARTVGLNLANSNTWTALQTFNYSSSTIYSSFSTASTTNLSTGFLTISTTTAGTLKTSPSGLVWVDTSVATAASSTLLADFNTFSNTNNFTGSIGLSTTSPFARLSINNTAGEHAFVVGSSTATHFIVDRSGNVGVGIAVPTAQLHVYGSSVDFRLQDTDEIGFWDFLHDGSNQLIIDAGSSSNQAITFRDSNDLSRAQISVRSAQPSYFGTVSNVGIGTTTPAWLLQIATSSGAGFQPQLTLTDTTADTNAKHWNLSSLGGNFYLSTSTDLYATTSTSVLAVNGSTGAISIATSTAGTLKVSSNGLIWSDTSSSVAASSTLLADTNTWSGVNRFTHASSTYHSFSTASTTNLSIGGQTFIGLLGTGLSNSSNILTVANVPNSALQNSTISGIALGSNLADLTATDSTLTFSGSYNGSTARTIGLNLANANSWSAKQDFFGAASSTLFSANFAQIGGTATTTFTTSGRLGVASSSPFARLGVETQAGDIWGFAVGSSTKSLLSVSTEGFGTTTLAGLDIFGQSTSTSNVGFNITSGCFAINNNCISGGVGSGASSTLLADFNTFSNTNNFTGSIGLSTTSPFARLSINNTAGEHAFVVGSSTATHFIVDRSGNVGVGIANPSMPLNVRRDVNGDSGILIQNGTSGTTAATVLQLQTFDSLGSLTAFPGTYTGATHFADRIVLTSGTTAAGLDLVSQAAAGNFKIYTGGLTTGNERLRILSGGAVGISTTTPYYTLTIASSTGPQFALSAGTGIAQWTMRNAGGNLYFATTTVAGTATTTTSALVISNSGGVGIGTSTTNATLTLQGAAGSDILRVATSTSGNILTISSWGGFVQNISSTTAIDIQNGSGASVFTVDTTSTAVNSGIDITAGGSQTGNLLNFYSSGNSFLSGFTAAGGLLMNISSTTAIDIQNGSSVSVFSVDTTNKWIKLATSTSPVFTSDGQFTIGNAGTAASDGRIWIRSGATTFRFQSDNNTADYSEFFYQLENSEAGDVLSLATEEYIEENTNASTTPPKDTGIVRKSISGYDERIVGVYTDRGTSFNNPTDDRQKNPNFANVGMLGHVLTKVTNENGEIRPGDYITSSEKFPGYGMKATRSGQIVGVALESFGNSTTTEEMIEGETYELSKVMVLVSPRYQVIAENVLVDINTGEVISGDAIQNQTPLVLHNQNGSGPILELQAAGQERLLVANNGSMKVFSQISNSKEVVFEISNNGGSVFSITSGGNVKVAGTIFIESDEFAGSVATDDMGLAEINFTNNLGTGKPVVQLTPEGDVPTIVQVASWKKDLVGNYIGLVIKAFGTEGQAVSANVHYAIFGKREGYNTMNGLPILTNTTNTNTPIVDDTASSTEEVATTTPEVAGEETEEDAEVIEEESNAGELNLVDTEEDNTSASSTASNLQDTSTTTNLGS